MLKSFLDEYLKDAGYSVHFIDGETRLSLVQGDAEPDVAALTPDHMFRIASTSKTYVAAAVLRLMEQGKLALSQSIAGLVSAETTTILQGGEYHVDQITLWQLLNHTAGIFDHTQSDKYGETILEDTNHVWTAHEQLKAAMTWGKPFGEPGEKFQYSDVHYILLGEIIERITSNPLPISVRALLDFDGHDLAETAWELGDTWQPAPDQRAHQFLAGDDTLSWHPSNDLFGGGGLVATPRDVAQFYRLLMTGKIFDRAETLALMLSPDGHPKDSPYRLGLFVQDHNGHPIYEHAGFWGTGAFFDNVTGITVAGGTLQHEDYHLLERALVAFLLAARS